MRLNSQNGLLSMYVGDKNAYLIYSYLENGPHNTFKQYNYELLGSSVEGLLLLLAQVGKLNPNPKTRNAKQANPPQPKP